jgi:hypothetical protein
LEFKAGITDLRKSGENHREGGAGIRTAASVTASFEP